MKKRLSGAAFFINFVRVRFIKNLALGAACFRDNLFNREREQPFGCDLRDWIN